MTQIESIQQNIYFYKLSLNKTRKIECKNEIEKLHIKSAINFYIKILQDLKFSLNCAVKQKSK